MSQDVYSKMTVTGNAEILRDFVNYFENTPDDDHVYFALHHAYGVTHGYLNDNCYCVEGEADYFSIDALTLKQKSPGKSSKIILNFIMMGNGVNIKYA